MEWQPMNLNCKTQNYWSQESMDESRLYYMIWWLATFTNNDRDDPEGNIKVASDCYDKWMAGKDLANGYLSPNYSEDNIRRLIGAAPSDG